MPKRKPMKVANEVDDLRLRVRQLDFITSQLRHRLADIESMLGAERKLALLLRKKKVS